MSNINQLPLWCRECGATYESFDEQGVCTVCETANVLERHGLSLLVPVDGYSRDEAHEHLSNTVDTLIKLGILPEGTVLL